MANLPQLQAFYTMKHDCTPHTHQLYLQGRPCDKTHRLSLERSLQMSYYHSLVDEKSQLIRSELDSVLKSHNAQHSWPNSVPA